MSVPARIEADLFEAARAAGITQSRSAAQQITHWARIGRELEASAGLSHQAIVRVLSGHDPYDGLDEREQATVRAEWDEAISARLASLDLAGEFSESGDSWTEADGQGRVRRHPPGRA